ncbi:hypothetical protein [Aureimonas frigidaquae]|uniref:hypothetical protein n=1 Tax=Aureimonas frigidaquae TaxID=424757 RepID=UPI0007829D88|nr:hypothetical protein [Aureimonas frigidaquae]
MTDEIESERRDVLRTIQVEGIRAAADAAIAICQDPKAPAPARATAAGLLFRAAALGGFGKADEAERAKEPHEMTPEEIDRELRRMRESMRTGSRKDGVFD